MSETNTADSGTVTTQGGVTQVEPAVDTPTFQPGGSVETPQPDISQYVEKIPEKFRSGDNLGEMLEKMSQSYTELEKKFHTKPKPSTETPAGAPNISVSKPKETSESTEAPAFDWGSVDITKPLNEDTRKGLISSGVPESLIDQMQGLAQEAAQVRAYQIAELVGGRDKLEQAIQVAQETMDDRQLQELDSLLASGNMTAIKAVLGNLVKPQETTQETEQLIEGTVAATESSVEPYPNMAAYQADIRDPRYEYGGPKFDPKFYDNVMKRLAASNLSF